MSTRKICPCGSGLRSWWEHDARGIPLCRVCSKCKAAKLARFRPEVLSDPNYHADEPIEPDEDRLGFGPERSNP